MSGINNKDFQEECRRIEERAKLELLNNFGSQGLLNFDCGESNKVS